MSKLYQYYVEGDCERKLINELKMSPNNYLIPGKVDIFNFINKKISNQRIAYLKKNTIIILVYDIDVENTSILEDNISKLKKFGFNKIIHIQSINNFEEEIVYSTNLKNINSMYSTQSYNEFKRNFLHQKDIVKKLQSFNFDKNKLWSRKNSIDPFSKYSNKSNINSIKQK